MKSKPLICSLTAATLLLTGLLFSCATTNTSLTAAARGTGKIYLIGTGPGAPDLISVRAIDRMQTADVVFARENSAERFSRYLAGKTVISLPHLRYWEILEKKCWDPTGENREACGKLMAERGGRAEMIRSHVRQGKTVALLEGGDPCIFGSLRWIKQEFADEEFEVVPGISAFNAGNALLKREVADAYVANRQTRSVIITTPLRRGDRNDSIEQLADTGATLVFFMPTGFEQTALPVLRERYGPDTPVAVVCNASVEGREKIIYSTLADFPVLTPEETWNSIIYVGEFLKDAHGRF